MLERRLRNPDAEMRREAALAMAEMGPAAGPAAKALAMHLKDRDTTVRSAAAYAPGGSGPEAKVAVKPLADALKDNDVFVRRAAAVALGSLGPAARSASDALQEAAGDGDQSVRAAVAEAAAASPPNRRRGDGRRAGTRPGTVPDERSPALRRDYLSDARNSTRSAACWAVMSRSSCSGMSDFAWRTIWSTSSAATRMTWFLASRSTTCLSVFSTRKPWWTCPSLVRSR